MKKIVSMMLAVLLLTACSSTPSGKPSEKSSLNLDKISERVKNVAQNGLNEATEPSKDNSKPSDEEKEVSGVNTTKNTNTSQNGSNEATEPIQNQQPTTNPPVQEPTQPEVPANNDWSSSESWSTGESESVLPTYVCKGGRDWNLPCDYIFPEDLEGKTLYATEQEAMNASAQGTEHTQSAGAKAVYNNGNQIAGYIPH